MASPMPTSAKAANLSHHSPPGANPASPPNKRDLKSWWKGFKLPSKQHDAHENRAPGIFGVPLRQSITYANVAISLIDENGQSYIYGYVPIVVAKCGVFLKEKATGVEGIFRLSGSEKRIKELKHTFDSSDRYGKGLVWDGYTVHDAANVLRRYLNDLPEPVVPLSLYEKFRDPLRGATKQPSGDADGPQFVDDFDEQAAIKKYQRLIIELPPLNRQLLLYILDLLAVFAARSDENRMNSQNLAAIFQPGMLSHPNHAMAPEEYRLNQCVLIFLIENQDHFLIGMQGTAADENTKKEVESGTPTPSGPRGVTRTASNASAGANSVRKEGQLRRNRSTSSKHSRGEGSIGSPSPSHVPSSSGGLGRSNTVPSKKSPALTGGKFRKPESPGQQSPSRLEPMTPVRPVAPTLPPQALGSNSGPSNSTVHVFGPSQERLLDVPQTSTPVGPKERNLQSLFQRSPTESSEKRQPNKLKKKRIPGTLNISAHSSNTSLPHSNTASPAYETTNPMESIQSVSEHIVPPSSNLALRPAEPTSTPSPHAAPSATEVEQSQVAEAAATLPSQPGDVTSNPTPRTSQIAPHDSLHPDDVTRARKSPPMSIHSSFNEGSDIDQILESQQGVQSSDSLEKEKKKRWRLSRSRKDEKNGSFGSSGAPPASNIWSNTGAETSTTTVGSGGSKTRQSLTQDSSDYQPVEHVNSHDGEKDSREDHRGPIGWFKHKYREAKEHAEHRRTKSPTAESVTSRATTGSRESHGPASQEAKNTVDVVKPSPDGPLTTVPETPNQALKEPQQPPPGTLPT